MSQAIPSPQNCCEPCEDVSSVGPPGAQGAAGAAGTNGTDGENAFTTVDSFVMPAELANVTVTGVDSSWAVPGQVVVAGKAGSAAFGYFAVVTIPSGTSIELQNLEDTASGTYTGNSAPGTVFPNLTQIGPGGLQGPAGSSGAPTTASYWTRVAEAGLSGESALGLLATGYVKVTTGTGVPSSQAIPIPITDGGTGGITAAAARTALGLGTMATQSAAAVAITGGTTDAVVQTNVDINSGVIDATAIGGATPAAGAFTTLAASSTLAVTGNTTLSSRTFTPSSAIQSLLAGTTVSPDATKIRVVGSGGAVLLGNTPTITAPAADGQILIIMGTDDANTVTFQRESALPGSQLRLGAATRVLGLYDTLTLQWDAVLADWVELSFVDNT